MTAVMVLAMSATAFAAPSITTSTVAAPAAGQLSVGNLAPVADAVTLATSAAVATPGILQTPADDAQIQAATVGAVNLTADVARTAALLGNPTLLAAAATPGAVVTSQVMAVVNLSNVGAAQNPDGTYTVSAAVPGVQAGDAIAILHGSEIIVPVVSNGAVTFNTPGFSPFAIVKLTVSTNGVVMSPRTGEK